MIYLKCFLLPLGFIFLFPVKSNSFENKEVHPSINKSSSQPEQSNLDENLKNIGFQDGIKEPLRGVNGKKKEVLRWVEQGGKDEDADLRALNHFHDPTRPWEEAGIAGMGNSSLIWAQTNDASWDVARDLYYHALTTGAEEQFATLFVTLGQLMHLISDKAVPAHVRDDAHPEVMFTKALEVTHFEVWTKKHLSGLDFIGVRPPQSIFSQAVESQYEPISTLWDLDKYDTSNPEVSLEPIIGLSEYTNANFFSESTAFSTKYPYPNYPEKDPGVERKPVQIPDPINIGETVAREYWMKKATATDSSYRLSGVGYLTLWAESLYLDGFEDFKTLPPMDGYVFEDYAARLIPRAVGYSSALLDYFFRGEMQVASLPLLSNNSIYALRLNIQNTTTSQETMSDGYFSAVIRYTPIGGNPDGSDDIFVRSYEVDSGMLQYGEEGIDIELNFPESVPIENYESIKCMLVYRGTLGDEAGAVIGKAFTLGEMKFNEEWDNSLDGNHPWTLPPPDHNPDNGMTFNVLENGILAKDNVRFAGHETARYNSSDLDFMDSNNPDGMLITANTYLQFKIDDLSINEQPPAEEGLISAWQCLFLKFNNGRRLQFSQEGQAVTWNDTTAYYGFGIGSITVYNMYDLFQNAGIVIPEPLYLENISLYQQLWFLDDPSTMEHHQHMEVDYIRIIERHEETEQMP